jgi:PLP dependent protein
MTRLASNLQDVQTRIHRACEAASRNPDAIELLAVSKYHSIEAIRELANLGLQRFGENYVQEGSSKASALPDLEFVFIGPLQRNKAKPALTHFREIMTLDRPELATRLRHLAQELDVVRGVWIQVDLWGEATKMGGCTAEEIPMILDALGGDPHLPFRGFMTIPPPDRPKAFKQMAHLRETWQQKTGECLLLSMGMSHDLEAAIQAGTDQVRIGTALFGDR